MLNEAPQRFLITMRAWLGAERDRYVGNNSGKDGAFRKQILRLKRGEGASDSFRRGGKWPMKLAKSFKGYIYNKENLNDLTLKMGSGLRHPSKFMEGMAMMDAAKGGGTITSSRFMSLPVYKNLKRLGIESNFKKHFELLFKDNLTPIMGKGGTLLWFEKDMTYKRQRGGNPFKRNALMFIGKKQVKIKQHFDFSKQFYSESGAVIRRGMTALNRACRDLKERYAGKNAGRWGVEGVGPNG
jgi:hypothetical protein